MPDCWSWLVLLQLFMMNKLQRDSFKANAFHFGLCANLIFYSKEFRKEFFYKCSKFLISENLQIFIDKKSIEKMWNRQNILDSALQKCAFRNGMLHISTVTLNCIVQNKSTKNEQSDYITIDSQLDAQVFSKEMLSIGVIAYLIVFLPTLNLSMPIFHSINQWILFHSKTIHFILWNEWKNSLKYFPKKDSFGSDQNKNNTINQNFGKIYSKWCNLGMNCRAKKIQLFDTIGNLRKNIHFLNKYHDCYLGYVFQIKIQCPSFARAE